MKAIGVSIFLPTCAYGVKYASSNGEKAFLRPPGALKEGDFSKLCIKCGRCMAVCPEKTIFTADFGTNFLQTGTPVMDFQYTACNLCREESNPSQKMRCIEACPTSALADIKREQVRIGLAKIVKESCIAWQSTGCTICKDACPEKAIELTAKGLEPLINEDKCNGCGICQKVCPTAIAGAYKGKRSKGVVILPNRERV